MDYILLISRWFHISAAIVAVGGAMFMRFALLPAAKQTLAEDAHQTLREAVRARWARVVHVCIALLLLTGALNFAILAIPPKVEPMPYHAIFGVKFLAALVVFFISIALVGRSPGFVKMRAASRPWLMVVLVLAGLIVLLSGILNQVRSEAKAHPVAATPAVES